MIIDRFQQQPREIRVRQIDYTEFFSGTDTLSDLDLPTVEIQRICGDVDDSLTPFSVYSVGVDVPTNRVTYFTTGGASGNQYQVTFLVDTESGQRHEAEIIFTIKEI
jgi:hypothetical protein